MTPITSQDVAGHVEELKELAARPGGAVGSLPQAERDAYREAQQSVVDARRMAETHEGLLTVG